MKSPYELCSSDSKAINMLSGFPSKSSLVEAATILKAASNDLFDFEIENDAERLIYCNDDDEIKMLQILSEFLSEQYQNQVLESDLIFTGGSSSGFIYLWSHLLPKDRKVIVASPTYQLLLNSLINDLKYEVESVPENSEGIDLELVENILKREYAIHGSSQDFSCGIYLVPTFSNPTGILYSENCCKKITKLAKEYNAIVVSDDVYNLLYASESPPKRLLAYETEETKGHIVSSGSFSKYLTPALRLGWIEAHPPLIQRIKKWGLLQSANVLGQLSALLITTAIKKGDLTRHIIYERKNLKSRLETAKSILKNNLNNDITISPSMGGYFIWITFPNEFPVTELQKQCSESHVFFLPGYIHTNMSKGNSIRISVARADNLSKLEEGLKIICNIINKINKL